MTKPFFPYMIEFYLMDMAQYKKVNIKHILVYFVWYEVLREDNTVVVFETMGK